MDKLKKFKLLIKSKLNNFLSYLFHYQFIIPIEIFYKIRSPKYHIILNNDMIICYGSRKLKEELNKYAEVTIINNWQNLIKVIFLKRFIFTILFIIILLFFISSSKIIREVKFKDESMYDKRIYDYVYNKLDKTLFFYTYQDNLNDLSLELRANFPNYAYIGVTRYSSCLLIDIEKVEINKDKLIVDSSPCDIISCENGYIRHIISSKGVSMVAVNQFVTKGTTLIAGNLDIITAPSSTNNLVNAEGIILAETLEYKKIPVKKKINKYTITNNYKNKYNIMINDKNIFKFANFYDNQLIKINNLFSIFKVIDIVKTTYFEEDFIDIIYDETSAYNYAESMIYYELELNRVSPLEKILEITLLDTSINDESFVFGFVIKKIHNIGVKKKIIN